MLKSIMLYLTHRYGNIATIIIVDSYKEFSYISGCNFAVIVPEKYLEKFSITLLSNVINEANITME